MKLHIIVLSAIIAYSAVSAFAQGNNQALGTDKENTQSLAERILNLEKKTDAVNVYLNTNVAYQEHLGDEDKTSKFIGKQLRFEMLGTLNQHWSYRFRYRLNRPGEQQDDNFSNNIDIMMIRYRFNERFDVSAGKLGVVFGGYQYDANPIQVLEFCDYLTGIDGFHMGVHGCYNLNANNTFAIGLYNTDNNEAKRYYSEDPSLKQAKHPFATSFYWAGGLFGNKVRTLWSYSLIKEVSKYYGNLLMLGTQLNLGRWQATIDYYGAWEQIDHHKIVTSEAIASRGNNAVMRNTSYHSVLADITYQPTPHWLLTAGARLEKASAPDDPDFKNYRTSYGYQAAVQWIPDLSQDARISLAYIGKTVDYNSRCQLSDYSTNRIELNLIYRIKVF